MSQYAKVGASGCYHYAYHFQTACYSHALVYEMASILVVYKLQEAYVCVVVCRSIMQAYTSRMQKYIVVCRSILVECRSILVVCRSILVECRSILVY